MPVIHNNLSRFEIEETDKENQKGQEEEETKDPPLKTDDMEFVGPGFEFEPVESGRDSFNQPKRSTVVLEKMTKGKRLRKVLTCLPLSRRKLEEIKNVKVMNSFQESSSA